MKALELPTIDADVAADAGLHPDIHIPYFICVRCELDIDDTPQDIENHYQHHRYLEDEKRAVFVNQDRSSVERQMNEQRWDSQQMTVEFGVGGIR